MLLVLDQWIFGKVVPESSSSSTSCERISPLRRSWLSKTKVARPLSSFMDSSTRPGPRGSNRALNSCSCIDLLVKVENSSFCFGRSQKIGVAVNDLGTRLGGIVMCVGLDVTSIFRNEDARMVQATQGSSEPRFFRCWAISFFRNEVRYFPAQMLQGLQSSGRSLLGEDLSRSAELSRVPLWVMTCFVLRSETVPITSKHLHLSKRGRNLPDIN